MTFKMVPEGIKSAVFLHKCKISTNFIAMGAIFRKQCEKVLLKAFAVGQEISQSLKYLVH